MQNNEKRSETSAAEVIGLVALVQAMTTSYDEHPEIRGGGHPLGHRPQVLGDVLHPELQEVALPGGGEALQQGAKEVHLQQQQQQGRLLQPLWGSAAAVGPDQAHIGEEVQHV